MLTEPTEPAHCGWALPGGFSDSCKLVVLLTDFSKWWKNVITFVKVGALFRNDFLHETMKGHLWQYHVEADILLQWFQSNLKTAAQVFTQVNSDDVDFSSNILVLEMLETLWTGQFWYNEKYWN